MKLAVYAFNQNGSKFYKGDEKGYIYIFDALTGGVISRSINIIHGTDKHSMYISGSDSMHWDNYNKVHFAFQLVGDEKEETADGHEYEARLRIARVDVSIRN